MTNRSRPTPIPPHGGNPYSTARKKSSSIGCASTFPDRKSTRLNSSHLVISYAVFCLKKKKQAEHGRGLAEHAQRDRSARIHPGLERHALPPPRQQPRLPCLPPAGTQPPPRDSPRRPCV